MIPVRGNRFQNRRLQFPKGKMFQTEGNTLPHKGCNFLTEGNRFQNRRLQFPKGNMFQTEGKTLPHKGCSFLTG